MSVQSSFDPYLYLCLTVYSENKDVVMHKLNQVLKVDNHKSQKDFEIIKTHADRINIFLYFVCYGQAKYLSKPQLAQLFVDMNKNNKFPLDYKNFIGLDLLDSFDPTSPISEEENKLYQSLLHLRGMNKEDIQNELIVFVNENNQKISIWEYQWGMLKLFVKDLKNDLIIYGFIVAMIILGIYTLIRSEKKAKMAGTPDKGEKEEEKRAEKKKED